MTTFLIYLTIGVVTGSIYAVAATGLVVTYTTSRIFNVAHGALACSSPTATTSFGPRSTCLRSPLWRCPVLVFGPLIGVLLDYSLCVTSRARAWSCGS